MHILQTRGWVWLGKLFGKNAGISEDLTETRVARYHNIYGYVGTFDGEDEKAPAALCRKIIKTKKKIKNIDV